MATDNPEQRRAVMLVGLPFRQIAYGGGSGGSARNRLAAVLQYTPNEGDFSGDSGSGARVPTQARGVDMRSRYAGQAGRDAVIRPR